MPDSGCIHFLLLLLSPGTAISTTSAEQTCCPAPRLQHLVVCVQSRVRLYTYIPQDFDFLRLYHWFTGMLEPLIRTRQAILLTQTPVDDSCYFLVFLLTLQLCQLAAFTRQVHECLFSVLAHSASRIAFLFIYFHFDDVNS